MTEKRAPPQLIFDDGSRVMTEESLVVAESNSINAPSSIRGSTPLDVYYEVDHIANEIVALFRNTTTHNNDDMLRIALQFPDELLSDSPEVCWLLEEKLASSSQVNVDPLVFCLGDTTVGSCCPDEVAALHLEADVLVHYGHACLSPTGTLPVIYSFGRLDMDVPTAVQCIITKQKQQEQQQGDDDAPCRRKFLLLYQVGYHHAMEDLQTQLSEQGDVLVVAGQLPQPSSSLSISSKGKKLPTTTTGCCGGDAQAKQESCCGGQAESSSTIAVEQSQSTTTSCPPEQEHQKEEEEKPQKRPLVVGGLELPETILSWDQLSDYTVLFIGEPESTSQRQYVNIMLLFLSLSSPLHAYWTYSPKSQSLTSDLPTSLQRQLKRRFFLTQKARDARVFGILVSNLSQQHLIQVVKSLKQRIQDAGKASYSFSVGKINPAKLANFAEIDCFVLVACREHSLLGDDREYHVPVITPLELDIALGNLTWGAQAYSLDCQDVLQYNNNNSNNQHNGVGEEEEEAESSGDDEEDEDAPYFSLVTGQYVQRTTTTSAAAAPLDLEHLPGKGQVTAHKSEAANFLKQREYQGLSTLAGQTEPKAAVAGQRGIASDYSGS